MRQGSGVQTVEAWSALVGRLGECHVVVSLDDGRIVAANAPCRGLLLDVTGAEAVDQNLLERIRNSADQLESFGFRSERDDRYLRVTPIVRLDDVVVVRVDDVSREHAHALRRQTLRTNLERAERFDVAGRVAGAMAHEFNNLLAVILNHADLLATDDSLSSESSEDVGQIREAALEAAGLTKKLLLFGRNDMAKPTFVSLRASLERIAEECERECGTAIELEHGIDDDATIWVHPGQWDEAIRHLLQNALEASEGESPRVRTESVELAAGNDFGLAHGRYATVAIEDEGSGMTEAVARRAFEPFFSTKERTGAGLGLSLAYGIATGFGGHATIDSTSGEGTTVTLFLPQHDDSPVQENEEDAPARVRGDASTKTILVVEDEPGVLRAVQRILSANGYKLLVAKSGSEALEIVESYEGDIDLLLTDVVMPGMSGVQLAKRVMCEIDEIKILYMSGYTESALSLDQLVAGKTDLILKPFTATDLLEVIEMYLGD
jgi:signal transduction histidine kinase